jgi:hypothetical protein
VSCPHLWLPFAGCLGHERVELAAQGGDLGFEAVPSLDQLLELIGELLAPTVGGFGERFFGMETATKP